MSEQTRTSSRTWISSPSHDLPVVELNETIPSTWNRVKKSSALICYQMLTIGAKLLWLVNKSSGLISYCCIVATYFLQEKSLLQGKLDSYCFRISLRMEDDAPDLVMRLYWDCQKLQERLNQLPFEREARKGAIVNFLGQMEAKYPESIPEFQPDISWFNVGQPVTMASLRGTLPLLDFFTYCCVNCHHILPGWKRWANSFSSVPALQSF